MKLQNKKNVKMTLSKKHLGINQFYISCELIKEIRQ